MARSKKQLGEILIAHRIITQQQLDDVLEDQRMNPRPLGKILIQRGLITEKLLLQALAAQKGVSAWHFDQDAPDPAAIEKLSDQVCRQYNVLPVRVQGDLLLVAMSNPDDIETIDLVRNLTGMRIEPVMAEEVRLFRKIEEVFSSDEAKRNAAKNVEGFVRQALKDFAGSSATYARLEKAVLTEEDTRPVVGLVNQIIQDAIEKRASDIHIEPQEDQIDVRLRIDGQLIPALVVPSALGPMLSTRIKILAGIDIVETRVPQDGRISAELGSREIDLRISVLPSYHGPRIVMRVLDKAYGVRKLDELGFDPGNYHLFRQLVEKPYGLFLVTGPTGSGKTTTLYAALNELKDGRNNIMTCEDPVEYLIAGVNQSQVNEKVGLTFATQLRAILRQDPDVVLVGEIRDRETAETAIRASMTGHMVLSTLHTNDAPSAVPRLLDMGIDPFLLSTSLVGVMSQRLLRVLCDDCKRESEPDDVDAEVLRSVFGAENVKSVWKPIGCPSCLNTGYKGRMAVHELMPVTPGVSKMIAERVSIESIREEATYYGYRTMQEDSLARILNGETSIQEAKRQIAFDTIERKTDRPSIKLAA